MRLAVQWRPVMKLHSQLTSGSSAGLLMVISSPLVMLHM